MGSLPAVGGLIVLVIFFSIVQPLFPASCNFGNMITAGARRRSSSPWAWCSCCCSARSTCPPAAAGVCAAVMARLMVGYDWPWPLARSSPRSGRPASSSGSCIGWLRAKVRDPVLRRHAGLFLAFQGVVLYIVNNGPRPARQHHAHRQRRARLRELADADLGRLGPGASWSSAATPCRADLTRALTRTAAGLPAEPFGVMATKIGALRVVAFLFVFLLNQNRALNKATDRRERQRQARQGRQPTPVEGVPWVVAVMLVLFVVLGRSCSAAPATGATSTRSAATTRPPAGPASPSTAIRISVFVICSVHGGRRRHLIALERRRGQRRRTTAATRCCSRSARPSSAAPACSAARAA